jgi:NTP pyrophosphatase (non-canonical NTP hydrolase)
MENEKQANEIMSLTNLDDYHNFVRSTKIYDDEATLIYPVLGLTSEAGEVAGKVKKLIRDMDGQLTPELFNDIISELGDVIWYVSAIADDLGATLSDVIMLNYSKLSSRKARNVISGDGDHR